MRYIKGPDFPTGGIVVNKDDLLNIYETGHGKDQDPGQGGGGRIKRREESSWSLRRFPIP